MFTIQSLLTCHQRKSFRTTTRGLTSLPWILSEGAALQPPLTGTPGPSAPLQAWSGVSPPAYMGLGGQEGPGAPGGEEVPHSQTGPGNSGMLPSARVWFLDRPSSDVYVISPDAPLIPAHEVLLSSSSCLLPSSSSSSSSLSYTSRALKEKLETTRALQKCPGCQIGQVVPETSTKEYITVYGCQGMQEVESKNYRCNNRNLAAPCRAGIYLRYVTVSGHVVFKNDALHHEVLVTSEQTGFDIEYLVDLANRVQLQSATLESEAKVFNRKPPNLPFDVFQKRLIVDQRRISEAYFLFTYLEAASRYDIPNYQVICNNNMEDTILKHMEEFDTAFREKWTVGHSFDIPGCRTVLVKDGGLTPHRPVCAAKLSAMKVFEEAGITSLTGCPKMPINKSKFCHDHESCKNPIVSSHEVYEDKGQSGEAYR